MADGGKTDFKATLSIVREKLTTRRLRTSRSPLGPARSSRGRSAVGRGLPSTTASWKSRTSSARAGSILGGRLTNDGGQVRQFESAER